MSIPIMSTPTNEVLERIDALCAFHPLIVKLSEYGEQFKLKLVFVVLSTEIADDNVTVILPVCAPCTSRRTLAKILELLGSQAEDFAMAAESLNDYIAVKNTKEQYE